MAYVEPGKEFSSFDYYRALFDNPKKNSVLLLDDEGFILQVNKAFLLSFGYEHDDLIGEHFSLLFTPEDREKDMPMREVQMVLDEGQSFDNNYLVNKNGVLTWASGESVLLKNDADGRRCVLKVIQNIHIQKESERSISRLNSFNESILASIEDAVLVIDPALKLVKANRAFYELFSVAEAHLHLVDFLQLLQGMDRGDELYAAVVNMFGGNATGKVPIQVELSDAHGQLRCFDVSLGILDHSEHDNVLVIFHDVTTQRNQERQREDILNFVAHELRNPLTNIMLNIDWLDGLTKERGLDGIGEFIDRTKRNAERLKKLVNELYKSTKLISGNYDLQPEAFDLDALIEECIHSMRQAHPNYTIVRKGVEGLQLSADKDKVMQVLINYLSNAIKYSDGSTYIEVAVAVREDSVVVCVIDKGKGIPASELPYIFNRFYRAEKTRSLEGLGVGLFLSRQIVEAHRGRTWVESVEGKGSTFYFSLPIG